jgi:putative ABC transport system substrate-binding protein
MSRKSFFATLLVALMILLTACGEGETSGKTNNSNGGAAANADGKSYRVAISQFVEHPSLNAVKEGIVAALADGGIVEGKNLVIDFQNAQADFNNLQPISQKIKEGKPDVAVGIATPSAAALVDEITDLPVVFAAVTDPLREKLVPSLEAPGGNVTGASDSNPDAIHQLMDFIAAEFTEIKKIGIVINKGEPNAVVMAETASARLAEHGIELIEAPIANSSDIPQAAQSLVGRIDALYVTLDNTVVEAIDILIDTAYEYDLPLFSSDRDTVEAGAFATVGFKYYDHGYEVGQMLLEILKDGKNPGDLNVSKPQNLDFIINVAAAEEMGITVTDEMKAYVKDPATNVIE